MIVSPEEIKDQLKTKMKWIKRTLSENTFVNILLGESKETILSELSFVKHYKEIVLVYILVDGYRWPYCINIKRVLEHLINFKKVFTYIYKSRYSRKLIKSKLMYQIKRDIFLM